MKFFKTFDIAASGMKVQQKMMDVVPMRLTAPVSVVVVQQKIVPENVAVAQQKIAPENVVVLQWLTNVVYAMEMELHVYRFN